VADLRFDPNFRTTKAVKIQARAAPALRCDKKMVEVQEDWGKQQPRRAQKAQTCCNNRTPQPPNLANHAAKSPELQRASAGLAHAAAHTASAPEMKAKWQE